MPLREASAAAASTGGDARPRSSQRLGVLVDEAGVVTRPARKSSCSEVRISQATFVRTPSTGNCRSAATARAIAASRVSRRRDQLGEQRIVLNRTSAPSSTPLSMRIPGPTARDRAAASRPAAEIRSRDLRRRRGIRLRGRAGRAPPAATAAERRRRPSSCARTRSVPVTASVIPCSTCSRVFISRK